MLFTALGKTKISPAWPGLARQEDNSGFKLSQKGCLIFLLGFSIKSIKDSSCNDLNYSRGVIREFPLAGPRHGVVETSKKDYSGSISLISFCMEMDESSFFYNYKRKCDQCTVPQTNTHWRTRGERVRFARFRRPMRPTVMAVQNPGLVTKYVCFPG